MAANLSFRDAMRALDEATKCTTCGKARMRSAIAWRGRGTGQRGASHYAATAFERDDPTKHCMCHTPGMKAIAGIQWDAGCDTSTVTVHNAGDLNCAHEWAYGGTRTDAYSWRRCVECPCEVGCEIPLPF